MASNRFIRIVSFFLVLTLLLNMLPVSALAKQTAEQPPTPDTVAEVDSDNVFIVDEVIENRSEFIKEFRLSNGLHMAAVYASAVHYEEDGQWQEIDNTLKLANTRSGNVYTNTAGSWQVSFPQSLTANNGVTITKDGHFLNFRMGGELHYGEADAEIMDTPDIAEKADTEGSEISTGETIPLGSEAAGAAITPTVEVTEPAEAATAPTEDAAELVEESTAPTGETIASEEAAAANEETTAPTEVTAEPTEQAAAPMAETTVPTEAVTAPAEEVTILTEEAAEPSEMSTGAEEENPSAEANSAILDAISAGDTITLAEPAGEITAFAEDVDTLALAAEAEYEETVVDTLYSRLSYGDVYENTDIIFELNSNQVKESIVMNAYSDTLYGYTYILDVGQMSPVVNESGAVELYDKEGKELIMILEAPYLVDSGSSFCFDVEVRLDELDGTYILSYLLPQEWLAAEERQWPVILDPIVSAESSYANIEDVTVYSDTVNYLSYTSGVLFCGYHPQYKITRSYLKYNALPALTSADVVVSASMGLYNTATTSNNAIVEVHKVTETWSSSTANWSNQAAVDTLVEDFGNPKSIGYSYWDVTDIVRGWYEGENTGMMFKMSDADETAQTAFKQFYSSDFGYLYQPSLSIMFRNNNGLESYWDYTASSAGRAGTGYVNHYTGNLVFVRDDIGFGGTRMPVTISHIYNANDSMKNEFGMGNGWRTNFNQKVYNWSVDSSYYVWEDGDGTSHYFQNESDGIYKDEDGLELTLTTTGSGTKTYCITDKYGNTSYFDSNGRLTQQTNNQKTQSSITVTYSDTVKPYILQIVDGAGRKYGFQYSGTSLRRISYYGTGTSEISYAVFTQTNSQLTSVTDNDGSSTAYTYTTNNLLQSAQDVDGYKLTYDYTTTAAGKPSRVSRIREYSNTTAGGELGIEYGHSQTKFTDHNGNVQIVQFNDWGNTISIQDGQGRAQHAKYSLNWYDEQAQSGNAKGNQLLLASKLQNTVGNALKDSSFEGQSVWTVNSGIVTTANVTEKAYQGSRSLKVERASAGSADGVYSSPFTAEAGATYTFSAYVNTTGTVYLGLYELSSNTMMSSQTQSSTGGEWVRMEVSYTNETASPINLYAFLLTATAGTTYMDCVQAEKAPTASRYNLVENGDFRYTTGWSSSAGRTTLAAGDKAPAAQLSTQVYAMTGSPAGTNRISQTVNISGSEGDAFVLSGWARGDSAPLDAFDTNPREFSLIATFKKGSAVVNTETVRFNPCVDSATGWQYAARDIQAGGAYDTILIELAYDYNVNTVCFDGIQLYREEFGTVYEYDENGNVTKATDIEGGDTKYTYNSTHDLVKVELPDASVTTYTYDGYHNVKTATTNTGVVYTFGYDAYGNNTSVSIGSGSTRITSSAAYTDDGNRLSSTTDAAGKVTLYSYNANTNVLEWVQYPEDTEATRTEYTYDAMYRLASASADVSTGSTLSAAYGYTNDLLTSIQTGSTTYSFTYGAFALRSNIAIGSRTLASYSYTSRNNYLEKLAYGNGDSVQYTYDDIGRVTVQSYEDGDTVSYAYDNNGALAAVTDSATGITTKYFYDFTDRLMKYTETGGSHSHSVAYTYDAINNLTAQVETVNGEKRTLTYTYDDDNRVTKVQDGATQKTYLYDEYGRISQRKTNYNLQTDLIQDFTYRTVGGSATGQVEKVVTTAPGYSKTQTYTYDDNGNITSVSDGTNTTSYVYDSANQLTRENNQAAGKTWTYSYDKAGNITSRKEYAYTTGTLGTATDTISYTYGDNEWGDLLTGYDGKTVTSDEIGNVLMDGDWYYSWEHGRQLGSVTGELTRDFGMKPGPATNVKNGLYVDEDGETRYYMDGEAVYAGLIYVDGYYYYINSSKIAVRNRTYTIGYNNGLLPSASYTFDANGRIVDPPDTYSQVEYTYNSAGLRTGKRVSVGADPSNLTMMQAYTYVYNGGKLTYMTAEGHTVRIGYDVQGPLYIKYDGMTYQYVTNLQGDVIAIMNYDGTIVVEYTYDAWGNILSCTGSLARTLGKHNPLRYRGYVYDIETGLYYLQSRYYNPQTGRFNNADALVSTGQGLLGNNMFAYCGNNPIMFVDQSGTTSRPMPIAIYDDGSIYERDNQPMRDVTDEVLSALAEACTNASSYSNMAYFFFGDNVLAMGAIYIEFYNQVNHKAPWDIKRPEPWSATIGTPYPGYNVHVLFCGMKMTPENLGNFTYGFLGYAYGIPLDHLIAGSYYAAGFPTEGDALGNEIFDWFYVALGYECAENAYYEEVK